jgi:hypothetical protein
MDNMHNEAWDARRWIYQSGEQRGCRYRPPQTSDTEVAWHAWLVH